MSSHAVYIASASRTPVGSFNGALKSLTAPQLGVVAVKDAIEKAGLKPDQIEAMYIGNVLQANIGQAPARQVVLGAGCPDSTEATTINKVCASGMKAITMAAQNIMTEQCDIMVAGGMESMSNAPFYFPRNAGFGHQTASDAIIKDGLWDVYNQFHMGNCAEKVSKDLNITRADQDEIAATSYKRAAEAWKNGAFKNEIAPVTITDRKGSKVIEEDEEYKKIDFEKMKTLKPAFQKDGVITAANASTLNDGASAVVLISEKIVNSGVKPLAKIISFADGAVAPVDFILAPALKAIPDALKRAGLEAKDIHKYELNEAFAPIIPASAKALGIDAAKINVHGGAIALGHPIGSSGSRIVVSLIHSLQPGEYGCAGVCNGGGASSAIIVQRM